MTAAARVHQVLYYQAAPHLPPRDLSGLSMGIGLSMGMGLSIFMSTCTGHALIGLSCSCDNERPMNINKRLAFSRGTYSIMQGCHSCCS